MPGGLLGGVDVVERLTGVIINPPTWVIWVTLFLGFLVAVVLSFHDLRTADIGEIRRLEAAAGHKRTREGLADYLAERIRELRALEKEVEPLTVPSTQTHNRIRAAEDALGDLWRRVTSELRLAAPEWVDYFMQNPDWYEGYIVQIGDGDRQQVVRLIDFTVDQLNRIHEDVRS